MQYLFFFRKYFSKFSIINKLVFVYFCGLNNIILRKIKIVIFSLLVLLGLRSQAQNVRILSRDSTWRSSGIFTLNIGQTSFTNWAGGGENQVNINSILHYRLQYQKSNASWENNFEAKYGILLFADLRAKKTIDKIDYASKFGKKASKNWKYSYYLSYISQFTKGYKYPNDSTVVSDFMAPAYFMAGVGMDYNPTKTLSILINPITYKLTIVNNASLANDGNFGMEKAVYDANGNILVSGKRFKSEPGAFLKAHYQESFKNGLSISSKLGLFSAFLKNPENIDINWSTFITYKISKLFSATFSLDVVYDDDAIINIDTNGDGIKEDVGPRLQAKEAFGIGVSLSL